MLTIRKEMFEVFAAKRRQEFEIRLERHLIRFFPEQAASLGTDGLHLFIGYGSARASTHGFNTERDICKYLDLMCVFGRDFDSDQRLPWAAEILHRPFRTSRLKMNRLMEAALERAEGSAPAEEPS